MGVLTTYLADVAKHLEATDRSYADLRRPEVRTHPIPFFGEVDAAEILTVGVNPSAREFVGRSWPADLSQRQLAEQLTQYFAVGPVAPHQWFEVWTKALEVIGMSYQMGAAHVDLSPRATAAMVALMDWKLFLQMVESDVRFFFSLLSLCQRAKAILAAGCVTKRWYINDFIRRVAPRHGFRLEGRAETVGAGRVGIHRLIGPSVDLPMFFCSVSPSANNKHLLVERVREHQTMIREWLGRDAALTERPGRSVTD